MPVIPGGQTSAGIGLTSATFPLAMPSLPSFAKIAITMRDIVGVSRSPFSGKRKTYKWPGEWLEASVALPGGMMLDTARAWCAWLALLRGQSGTFLLSDTSLLIPRGVVAGAPVVHGAQSAGSQTLNVAGWTPGTQKVLRSGDWIQTGGNTTPQRLYMNCLDVDADGGGYATLNLYPCLREDVADGDGVVVENCAGTFALAANDRKFDVDNALQYGISFDAVEAI